MNTSELKGNWNEQKGKLKQKFAQLTDNDLMFAEGKKEEMMGKLQVKLGKTKENISISNPKTKTKMVLEELQWG